LGGEARFDEYPGPEKSYQGAKWKSLKCPGRRYRKKSALAWEDRDGGTAGAFQMRSPSCSPEKGVQSHGEVKRRSYHRRSRRKGTDLSEK